MGIPKEKAKGLNHKCRGCLGEITRENSEPLSDDVVRNLYKECVRMNISESNELPQYLCMDCHAFCVSWSNFKQKCNISENCLKRFVKKQKETAEQQERSTNTQAKQRHNQEELVDLFDANPLNSYDYYLDCNGCGDNFPPHDFFQHNCVVDDELPLEVQLKTEQDDSDNEFNNVQQQMDEPHSSNDEDSSDDEKPKKAPGKKTVTLNAKRYPCKQCGIRFRRPIILKKHEMSHVIVQDPRCYTCNMSFSSVIELEEHCTVLHNLVLVYNYRCMYCKEKFSKYPFLIKHLYKHEEAIKLLPQGKHQCPKCDDTKSSEKALMRHVKVCVPFSFTCKECGQVCKNVSLYRTHTRSHIKKVSEPFLCTTCGKSYKSKKSLRDHSSTHAEHTEKCEICHRNFSGPVRLNVHMQRVHHNKKRVKCEICELDFRDAYSMRAHMAQHEKPQYTCSICDQGFKFKLSLERHEAKCYPGKKPKPAWAGLAKRKDQIRVHCPCCGMGFCTLKLFRKHLEDVHRQEGIDLEEAYNSIKNIGCPQCSKKFATQVNLKDHMLTHSTLKPFECEVCSKAFRDSTLLNYHMLTHKK